jgi:hypothetical protein
MINAELILRAVAVLAAVAVVAGPSLVAAVQKALAWRPAAPREKEVTWMSDAHTVLEIASRLKAADNTEGVDLCQQLIDVMLK